MDRISVRYEHFDGGNWDAWLYDKFVEKPQRENEYVGRMVWFSKDELVTRFISPNDFYKEPEEDMAGSHGFRRPMIGMAVAVLAAFGVGSNIPPLKKAIPESKPERKEKHKLFNGSYLRGNSRPHQGHQECARRVRQGVAGTQYVHGAQYPMQNPYRLEHWGGLGRHDYDGKKW